MVKVIAKFFVKEDKVEEFLKLAGELVQESRKDKGCINYNMVQDLNNKQIFVMLEEWESSSALKTHMASAHLITTILKMTPLMYQENEITVCKLVF